MVRTALNQVALRRKRMAGRRKIQLAQVNLNAAFDNAELNPELNELFARAQHESGLSGVDPQARRTLIDRSRYEILQANASFKGMARAAVNWVIGRGPFLECKIDGRPDAARQIESGFNAWLKAVKGPRKMRVMAYAKITDGPGLAMITNRRVPPSGKSKVTLNFVPFEDEQIKQPFGRLSGEDWQKNYYLDGKTVDENGDAVMYYVLPNHPVEDPVVQPEPVSANFVIDVFNWERPSQHRGIPELATSIGKGPMMRIYEKAVLDAATTAAKHTVLLETSIDKFDTDMMADIYQPVEAGVQEPIHYGTQAYLPAGVKASQMKAEQPTSTYAEFTRANVASAGRPIGQPSQVATGDSAGMNFAGGQLGRQDYEMDIDVQRQDWETECLDKLLSHWLLEAALLGEIPEEFALIDTLSHEWRWTRRRHQDTNREYTGRAKACAAGLTSPAFWQEDDGVDPEEEDMASARSHGLTLEQFREARFRQMFPEAAVAILGPGKVPPKVAPQRPQSQQGNQSNADQQNQA
jgi:hypothetical protein